MSRKPVFHKSTLPALFLLCLPLLVLAAESGEPTVSRADGHTLLAECGEIVSFLETGIHNDTRVGGSYCLGMINGMLSLNTIHQAQQQPRPLFCPPRDRAITNAEAIHLVVAYLRANPHRLDQDQASLMFFAFEQAWPCF